MIVAEKLASVHSVGNSTVFNEPCFLISSLLLFSFNIIGLFLYYNFLIQTLSSNFISDSKLTEILFKFIFLFAGMVKKCSVLKIVHDKYKKRRGNDPMDELVQAFDFALKDNKELEPLVSKTQVNWERTEVCS
jgi:hypothetical protein